VKVKSKTLSFNVEEKDGIYYLYPGGDKGSYACPTDLFKFLFEEIVNKTDDTYFAKVSEMYADKNFFAYEFVESLYNFFENKNFYTDKQKTAIDNVYDKFVEAQQ
jgi:hypothetical protein